MHVLLSADCICATTDHKRDLEIMYPPEFLNSLRCTGIANHKLELKIGVTLILLCNLNLERGL